jgi:hypothetical protein
MALSGAIGHYRAGLGRRQPRLGLLVELPGGRGPAPLGRPCRWRGWAATWRQRGHPASDVVSALQVAQEGGSDLGEAVLRLGAHARRQRRQGAARGRLGVREILPGHQAGTDLGGIPRRKEGKLRVKFCTHS